MVDEPSACRVGLEGWPRPGKWLLHCHIPHHTTNDNVEEEGAGGLTTIIDVRP